MAVPTPHLAARTTPRPETVDVIERGVARGILTRAQADALFALGRESKEAAPELMRAPTAPGRAALVAEALGYLGAALVTAAGLTAVGMYFDRIPVWVRPSVFGAVALSLLVAGVAVRREADPARRRLVNVLWLVSVAAATAFVAILADDTLGWQAETVALVASAAGLAYALSLWAARQSALQELAAFVLAGGTAASALVRAGIDVPWPNLAVWAVAVAWVGLALAGLARPRQVGLLAGALVAAVVVPFQMFGQTQEWWPLVLGFATAGVAMGGSIVLREPALLAFGAFGVFEYVIATVGRYLSRWIGAPVSLLVAGVLLIGLAVLVLRLRRLTRPGGGAAAGVGGPASAP